MREPTSAASEWASVLYSRRLRANSDVLALNLQQIYTAMPCGRPVMIATTHRIEKINDISRR